MQYMAAVASSASGLVSLEQNCATVGDILSVYERAIGAARLHCSKFFPDGEEESVAERIHGELLARLEQSPGFGAVYLRLPLCSLSC
jgi:hypothetical protein